MENNTIEIELAEYRELLDLATRVGVLRRIVKDEDAKNGPKGYGMTIDTELIRQILGMVPYEPEEVSEDVL